MCRALPLCSWDNNITDNYYNSGNNNNIDKNTKIITGNNNITSNNNNIDNNTTIITCNINNTYNNNNNIEALIITQTTMIICVAIIITY